MISESCWLAILLHLPPPQFPFICSLHSFPPTLHSWMQDFELHISLSLSSCLVSPFGSACLISSFSLFSHGEILLCHRGDSPALLLSEWFIEGKKELLYCKSLPRSSLQEHFLCCLLLIVMLCLDLSTNPEDALCLPGYSPQWSHWLKAVLCG